MKRYKIIMFMALVLFFLFDRVAGAETNFEKVASYRAPDGIEIISYTPQWKTQEQLKSVHQELLRNFYSKEIAYLSHINIYPHNPGVAGRYYAKYYWDSKGNRSYDRYRYINIYDASRKTKVEDIAGVLAHEYGHHFTYFWLWTKEGIAFKKDDETWRKSGYARVRNLASDSRITAGAPIPQWNIEEIAAEDYVQLFGSPNAKKSVAFKDENDRLQENISSFSYSSAMFNLVPQENRHIPLAAEVPGIEEYWRTLCGVPIQKVNKAPDKPVLILAEVKDYSRNRRQLVFRWTPVLDDSKGPLEYTLITYRDQDVLPVPIRTVLEGNNLEGAYGLGLALSGLQNFRIYVKDSQGKIVSSEVLRVNLDQPQTGIFQDYQIFHDVPLRFWAYRDIKELWELKIVKGYGNRTFLPQSTVTKGEFLAMLMRLVPGFPRGDVEFLDNSSHWAASYLASAAAGGILTQADYGEGMMDFNYDEPVGREEMAMMSARVAAKSVQPGDADRIPIFNDLGEGRYAGEVQQAAAWGIIHGYPESASFKPLAHANRAEAAKIIARTRVLLANK